MVSVSTPLLDLGKQVLESEHHDSRILHRAQHCMGLAGASGTVTEHRPIPPL